MATYALTPLANSISTTSTISEYMMAQWNLSIYNIKKYHTIGEVEVTPVEAKKYKFDLEGLFYNEKNIPRNLIYPHIIANGYRSSTQYDGGKLRLIVLDTGVLNVYYRLFKKCENL